MAFDRQKFKLLVHYIIAKAGQKPHFGATKLNKVLWFAEARQYMLTGKPIAGAEYTRQEYGPVPKLIMPIREELVSEGKIEIKRPKSKFEGWRFRSLRPPEVDQLSAEERQLLDYWIKYVDEEHTAISISEESHDYAWEIADKGEPLPFYAFFANRIREPNAEEHKWARDAAQRAGIA